MILTKPFSESRRLPPRRRSSALPPSLSDDKDKNRDGNGGKSTLKRILIAATFFLMAVFLLSAAAYYLYYNTDIFAEKEGPDDGKNTHNHGPMSTDRQPKNVEHPQTSLHSLRVQLGRWCYGGCAKDTGTMFGWVRHRRHVGVAVLCSAVVFFALLATLMLTTHNFTDWSLFTGTLDQATLDQILGTKGSTKDHTTNPALVYTPPYRQPWFAPVISVIGVIALGAVVAIVIAFQRRWELVKVYRTVPGHVDINADSGNGWGLGGASGIHNYACFPNPDEEGRHVDNPVPRENKEVIENFVRALRGEWLVLEDHYLPSHDDILTSVIQDILGTMKTSERRFRFLMSVLHQCYHARAREGGANCRMQDALDGYTRLHFGQRSLFDLCQDYVNGRLPPAELDSKAAQLDTINNLVYRLVLIEEPSKRPIILLKFWYGWRPDGAQARPAETRDDDSDGKNRVLRMALSRFTKEQLLAFTCVIMLPGGLPPAEDD